MLQAPMVQATSRREFLQVAAGAALGASLLPARALAAGAPEPPFRISLAEWSLHRAIQGGKLTNLDFPVVTRQEFDIEAVEYVSTFFKDKARDEAYLSDLKSRCEGEDVRSLLVMVDGEGRLGDPDEAGRAKAVGNHHRWVEAAKFLGCHSIRVNAASAGSFEEQQKLAADGLARLGEFADQYGINVLVENHGGLSSHGGWLAGVIRQVGRPNVGTLPDFGNFRLGPDLMDASGQPLNEWYDRYQGVEELMPYAKAVSAKSRRFDESGNESQTDFYRMMKIVLEAGYSGYVGIEWEGGKPDEYEGIRLTKQLLEKVRGGIA